MAVKYAADEVRAAKAAGESMATIAVAGLEFSGPIDAEEQRELVRYYLDFTERHAAKRAANTEG